MQLSNLISFVIPCYRSEATIEKVYNEIKSVVSMRPEYDYEIIAINDCSPDNVFNVLKKLSCHDCRFKVIDLAKNFGKHSAIMAGLSHVRGEYVVCLDDDFQCPVHELWNMMDAITKEGYDCATAKYKEKKESAWKRLGSGFNACMVRILIEPPKGIRIENFFVVKRYVCDEMLNYKNPFPYVSGLLLRATHRVKVVSMEERERADNNATGFTFKKSVSLFANALTAFSVKPLRIATILGVLFAIIGFVYGIVIVMRRIFDPEIMMGYSSLMAVQLFSSGVIMVILGMIGEYIGRIYISLNNSPQYVIRETINIEKKHEN